MKVFSAMLLAVAAGALAVGKPAEQEKQPSIDGKWEVTSAIFYGKEAKDLVGATWEFGDGKLVIVFANGRILDGKYQVEGDKQPWRIEIETAEDRAELGGGGPRPGIVAVGKDRLLLCFAGAANAPRPADMTSKRGTLNILREMKRTPENK